MMITYPLQIRGVAYKEFLGRISQEVVLVLVGMIL